MRFRVGSLARAECGFTAAGRAFAERPASANSNADFTAKGSVRCDVTEEFPFLVTRLSP
jgi:hypothetical protein